MRADRLSPRRRKTTDNASSSFPDLFFFFLPPPLYSGPPSFQTRSNLRVFSTDFSLSIQFYRSCLYKCEYNINTGTGKYIRQLGRAEVGLSVDSAIHAASGSKCVRNAIENQSCFILPPPSLISSACLRVRPYSLNFELTLTNINNALVKNKIKNIVKTIKYLSRCFLASASQIFRISISDSSD